MKRATRQLTSSLQSGDLKGKAYGSAKNYVLNVLNPLMNKASEGISDGLADLATYKYEDSQIAHYGNIDVAQLQAEKQTKEEARRRVVSQRESLQTFPLSMLATLSPVAYGGAIFAMNAFEHQMTDSIKDIDEKLLAFESFESNTNALFQDTNAVFEALQRAVNALNSIKISGSGAGLSLSMPSGMGGLVSKMTNSKLGAGDKDSGYNKLSAEEQAEIANMSEGTRTELDRIVQATGMTISEVIALYANAQKANALKAGDSIKNVWDFIVGEFAKISHDKTISDSDILEIISVDYEYAGTSFTTQYVVNKTTNNLVKIINGNGNMSGLFQYLGSNEGANIGIDMIPKER
ncbi:hypothetical protein [Lactococcus muris]|uniref:hypothetical protein n=1 Tax=Lactococcus muris TaxID=2941330 RepID=UPI003892343A